MHSNVLITTEQVKSFVHLLKPTSRDDTFMEALEVTWKHL